jgi:hypothetical protein
MSNPFEAIGGEENQEVESDLQFVIQILSSVVRELKNSS